MLGLFVKKSWNTKAKKRYEQFQLVESYYDAEAGYGRHRVIMNLTKLPRHVIDAIDQSLKQGKAVVGTTLAAVNLSCGDSLRGAGLLAIYRAWHTLQLPRLLHGFTPAEQQSVLAMVAGRILSPSSKLALKTQLADTLLARVFSRTRLDEDELYRVMDKLHEQFYPLQQQLRAQQLGEPVLCLYDLTSTYFEGTCAEGGKYGHSRDKRWDRYQIVIGLVCDEQGLPVAVEVWPGNTADRSTVSERVRTLKEQFGIRRAILVGDAGLYSQANLDTLAELGWDYILRVEWRRERRQLEAQAPRQLSLLDRGVTEWVEDGVRYVGCLSEERRERAAKRRKAGMEKAALQLQRLARTATAGRYYSGVTLRHRVNALLAKCGVSELWQVNIASADGSVVALETKEPLTLSYAVDEAAVEQRAAREGLYVLQTSLPAAQCTAAAVDANYRRLQYAERAFRHIKSYLQLRPVYHYKHRRIRAHVLICFLAFYLVKQLELELRVQGVGTEVELLLRRWEQLKVNAIRLELGNEQRTEWAWSLGEVGQGIKRELQQLGWWKSIDAYRHRLIKSLSG